MVFGIGKKKTDEKVQEEQGKDFAGVEKQANDMKVSGQKINNNDIPLKEPFKATMSINVRTKNIDIELDNIRTYLRENFGVEAYEGTSYSPL